jgi:hypothetical protein
MLLRAELQAPGRSQEVARLADHETGFRVSFQSNHNTISLYFNRVINKNGDAVDRVHMSINGFFHRNFDIKLDEHRSIEPISYKED